MLVTLMIMAGAIGALLALVLSDITINFVKKNRIRILDAAFITLLWLPFYLPCYVFIGRQELSTKNTILAYFGNLVVGYFIRGKNYKSALRAKMWGKTVYLANALPLRVKRIASKIK